MRVACFAVLAACGGGNGGGDDLRVTTQFQVTSIAGAGVSPLDPLANQTVDIEIVWPKVDWNHGTQDPAGCKSTGVGFQASTRTASGATADLVQREILDRLPDWDVRLQLCTAGSGDSTVVVESVIDALNLSFGCFGVPASAQVTGGDGYPALTSFTATSCMATILDVVNNRVLSNPSFSITFETGPSRIPSSP